MNIVRKKLPNKATSTHKRLDSDKIPIFKLNTNDVVDIVQHLGRPRAECVFRSYHTELWRKVELYGLLRETLNLQLLSTIDVYENSVV